MQKNCQNSSIYSALEHALKTQSVSEILMLGIEITNEIVAEI
jgi:hypothetical protein